MKWLGPASVSTPGPLVFEQRLFGAPRRRVEGPLNQSAGPCPGTPTRGRALPLTSGATAPMDTGEDSHSGGAEAAAAPDSRSKMSTILKDGAILQKALLYLIRASCKAARRSTGSRERLTSKRSSAFSLCSCSFPPSPDQATGTASFFPKTATGKTTCSVNY